MKIFLISVFSLLTVIGKSQDSLAKYRVFKPNGHKVMVPATIYYEDSVTKKRIVKDGFVTMEYHWNTVLKKVELMQHEGDDNQKWRLSIPIKDAKGKPVLKNGKPQYWIVPRKLIWGKGFDDSKYREIPKQK